MTDRILDAEEVAELRTGHGSAYPMGTLTRLLGSHEALREQLRATQTERDDLRHVIGAGWLVRAEAAEARVAALTQALRGLVEELDEPSTTDPNDDSDTVFLEIALNRARAVLAADGTEQPE